MSERSQLQETLQNALGGARFTSSQIQVLGIRKTTLTDTSIKTWEVLFFKYKMKMVVKRDTNEKLLGLTFTLDGEAPAKVTLDLIEEFFGGEETIPDEFKFKNYFPDNFPFEAGVTIKKIELGFEKTAPNDRLQSISFTCGTFSTWKILDTKFFDLDEINFTISNSEIAKAIVDEDIDISKNTILAIEAKFELGDNPDPDNATKLTLATGNISLDRSKKPKEILKELELKLKLENVPVPVAFTVDSLMKVLLSPADYAAWQASPQFLKNIQFDRYEIILKLAKKQMHVIQELADASGNKSLGGFEAIFKITEEKIPNTGSNTQKKQVKSKRNILVALTPPDDSDDFFVSHLGADFSSLDQLDLTNSGIIFSNFPDATEVHLKNLQVHGEKVDADKSKLKVTAGIQVYADIKFQPVAEGEDDPTREQVIQQIIDPNQDSERFTLVGFIAKDLTAYQLKIGVHFPPPGLSLTGKKKDIMLRAIQLGMILDLKTTYIGFQLAGLLDFHIKNKAKTDHLQFMTALEIGALIGIQTATLKGQFQLSAIKAPGEKDFEQKEGMPLPPPPVWKEAFGVPGLGLRQLGADLEIGVTFSTGIPAPSLQAFGFNADLQLGTVPGEEVTGLTILDLDVKKPTESQVAVALEDFTVVDIIEAFDDQKTFNLQGPLRELLSSGPEAASILIDPKGGTFAFSTTLRLGEILVNAGFSLDPTGISVSGSVTPITLKIPETDFLLFSLEGRTSPNPYFSLDLDFTNPLEAKAALDAKIKLLGGTAAAEATVFITPTQLQIEATLQLFGDAFMADIEIIGAAISPDGSGMYVKAGLTNDVLSDLSTALQKGLEKNYKADREKIEKARAQLAAYEKESSFLHTIAPLSEGFFDSLEVLQDAGKMVGSMLLDKLDETFNIDYIKFEGALGDLGKKKSGDGSAKIKAAIQLTIAGNVINHELEIDFGQALEDVAKTIESFLVDAANGIFNFLDEEFNKLKESIEKLEALFAEGVQYLEDLAEEGLEKVSDFFKDLIDAINNALNEIATGLDLFFQGEKFELPEAGGEIPYGPDTRHYSITLEKIVCTKTNVIFPDIIPDGQDSNLYDLARLYGFVIADPVNTMRLGTKNGKGNVTLFSARRGTALNFNFTPGAALSKAPSKEAILLYPKAPLNTYTVDQTKHFYARDGKSAKIVIRSAIRERQDTLGGIIAETILQDPGYAGQTALTVNLGHEEWKNDQDHVIKNSSSFDLNYLGLKTIRLYYSVILHGKISASTMKAHLKTGTVEQVKSDFKKGGDPAFPGLMEAAINSNSNPREKVQLLFDYNVKATTDDLSTAIKAKKWDIFDLLLDKGITPKKEQIATAITHQITSTRLLTMLGYGLSPSSSDLSLAMGIKNGAGLNSQNATTLQIDYLKILLKHKAPAELIHIEQTIQWKFTDYLSLVLENADVPKVLTAKILQDGLKKSDAMLEALLKRPIEKQEIFQLVLLEACNTTNKAALTALANAGARITESDTLEALVTALLKQSNRDNTLLSLALGELKGNANEALNAIIRAPGVNKNELIKICIDHKASVTIAITYAIDQQDGEFLKYLLDGKKQGSKASFALQYLMSKILKGQFPEQQKQLPFAKIALDAGANPNSLISHSNQSGPYLEILSKTGQHHLIQELLKADHKPAASKERAQKARDHFDTTVDTSTRQPVDPTPAILYAIRQQDQALFKVLVSEKVSFKGDPRFVEIAVETAKAHALLPQLLAQEAIVTPTALNTTISQKDFDSMGKLVATGKKAKPPLEGTSEMLEELMTDQATKALKELRTITTPSLDNFILAARENKTEYFQILCSGEPEATLADTEPLEIAITKKNSVLLKNGLQIGTPSQANLATETLPFAIDANWMEAILLCLEYGALTPLAVTYAIDKTDTDLLKAILTTYQGDPDQALAQILAKNKDELMEIALDAGADPNLPLLQAAEANQDSRVRTLVKYKGDPDLPMMEIIGHQNVSLVQYLVDNGADAKRPWYLELAIDLNNLEIIKILLGNGADPKGTLEVPVKRLQKEITWTLTRAGADVNEGFRIHLENGNGEMLVGFIKMHADLSKYLEIPVRRGQQEIVETMVEHGADPNTGLLAAVSNNHPGIVHFLLKQGADEQPMKLLQIAVEQGNKEIAELLIRYGASVNNQLAGGSSNLFQAVSKPDNATMIKVLLDAGAEVNLKNDAGDTPLHIAVTHGPDNLPAIKLLVEAGADVNAQNADGKRIIFVTKGDSVEAYLRSNGAIGRRRPDNRR